jgi:glycosyltransferase involved in cell wall biosynthesis
MRITWWSNSPWNPSGYAVETELFVPRIAAAGHEVALCCPYSFGGGGLEWQGIPMLGANRDPAGNDIFLPCAEYFRSDVVMVLADPFGLLKCAADLSQINVAFLFPVDCNPLGEGDVQVLRESQGIPIAISRFGERVLKAEGADPLYCPHGVDTETFSPGDPAPYRDTVAGIGDSTFTVGIVAMNRDRDRKGWSEQLMAFSRFHARHPDTHLALHTAPLGGVNLPGMAARLGIGSAISFPDGFMYDMGLISRENLADFYRGIDVLSLCSYGEGFGLPLIESQATGTPVITTDASAMSELCGAGWLVSGTPWWSPGHGAWWVRPDISDVEQAYEVAYQAWQDKKQWAALKESARAFALNYDIDRVFAQYMVPVLAELEKRIDPAKALSS